MTYVPPPFDQLWFCLLVGMVVGVCLGSFATMLSYRLPRRMSILQPRSHCTTCQTSLTARDLVPVVSWALSSGACRHCHAVIGVRYPLIELVTGGLSMIAFGVIGFRVPLIGALLAIVLLITLLTIQIEKPSRASNT